MLFPTKCRDLCVRELNVRFKEDELLNAGLLKLGDVGEGG